MLNFAKPHEVQGAVLAVPGGDLGDQGAGKTRPVRSSYVRGRGTETSAEVLVGPPWRMESNAGQQQWY
jgi:hypothetical protein